MTFSDFRQRVYNKLFITGDGADGDATHYGYSDMVAPLLNECLTLIANSDLSVRKNFKHTFLPVQMYNTRTGMSANATTYAESNGKFVYYFIDEESFYSINHDTTNDTYSWEIWNDNTDPSDYTFPEEDRVISVKYISKGVPGATFYVSDTVDSRITVSVDKPGKYEFVCECLYPEIDPNTPDVKMDIPESIATISVLYVASELLQDTDQQRAARMRNDFELALSRLDEERQDVQEGFTISSRW